MGHYTGVATRIKLKPEADKEVLEIFNVIYDTAVPDSVFDEVVTKQNANGLVVPGAVVSMLLGSSSYFETWCWRHKTPEGLYESRASTKREDANVMLSFLESVQNSLVLEKDDILVRFIYEEGIREYIIYFDGEKLVRTEKGFKYDFEWGVSMDPRHPYTQEKSDEEFIPPWNYRELQALNDENKRVRDAYCRNRFGF